MSAIAASTTRRARHVRERPVRRFRVGYLIGPLLVALVVVAALMNQTVRNLEAAAATWLLDHVFGYPVAAALDQIVFSETDGSHLALRVTLECTVLVLLVPLLLLSVGFLMATRISTSRWLLGTVTAAVLVIGVSLLRLVMIGIGYFSFGREGYDLTHLLLGTIWVVVGTVTAVLLMLTIFRQRKSNRP